MILIDIPLPTRLPNNNLHQYSKVLDQQNGKRKRAIPVCPQLKWQLPIFLNLTASSNLQQPPHSQYRAINSEELQENSALNLRRKLESQKGEVRSF